MTVEQKQAYEWAKNQDYQSVAARYAKTLAGLVDELHAEIDRLNFVMARDNARHSEEQEKRSSAFSVIWDLNEKYLAEIKQLEAKNALLKKSMREKGLL